MHILLFTGIMADIVDLLILFGVLLDSHSIQLQSRKKIGKEKGIL